jgi:membrane protease subunit HflK
LQAVADKHELGVEIVMAGVANVHPPAQVADAYEDVVNAFQEKEAAVYQGEAELAKLLQEGIARAVKIEESARRDGYRIERVAEADAQRFLVQLEAYRAAPEVYAHRKRIAALEELLAGHMLYILPITGEEVQIIDFQRKLRPELFEFEMEEAIK